MTLTPSQLQQYCQRAGYSGPLRPDLATLQTLHRLHPLAFTFENLDSWLGQAPALEPEALFDKLVLRQRGGYCFEQNGLFSLVLQTIGFDVQGLSARVLWNQPPDAQPPRTHQALMVSLHGEEWLVDVGFGGLTALGPLRMVTEREQSTPLETLRLRPSGSGLRPSGSGLLLEVFLPNGPRPMYWFHPEAASAADFIQSNWYVGTYPGSKFVQHLIASKVRVEPDQSLSRHNLFERDYTVYRVGQAPETRTLQSVDEVMQLLRDIFALPVDSLPALPAKLEQLFQA